MMKMIVIKMALTMTTTTPYLDHPGIKSTVFEAEHARFVQDQPVRPAVDHGADQGLSVVHGRVVFQVPVEHHAHQLPLSVWDGPWRDLHRATTLLYAVFPLSLSLSVSVSLSLSICLSVPPPLLSLSLNHALVCSVLSLSLPLSRSPPPPSSSSSLGVFFGYSGFLPSFIGFKVQPIR